MEKIILLFLFICFAQLGRAQSRRVEYGQLDTHAIEISIVQILCSPKLYDQKRVKVIGVYLLDPDASYLFLTKDHLKVYDLANSVELGVKEDHLPAKREVLTNLNGYIVAIEGVVHATGGTNESPIIYPITRILVKERFPREPEEHGVRQGQAVEKLKKGAE